MMNLELQLIALSIAEITRHSDDYLATINYITTIDEYARDILDELADDPTYAAETLNAHADDIRDLANNSTTFLANMTAALDAATRYLASPRI